MDSIDVEARRRQEAERRMRQQDADLRAVMSTPEGRRLLWRLIDEMAGAMNGSFVGEALQSAFNEGRRSVGLDLIREAQRVDDSAYVHMLREELSDRREQAHRLNKDTDE